MGNIKITGKYGNLYVDDYVWFDVLRIAKLFGWKKMGTEVKLNPSKFTNTTKYLFEKLESGWIPKSEREMLSLQLQEEYHPKGDYTASNFRIKYEIVSAEDAGRLSRAIERYIDLTISPIWGTITSVFHKYERIKFYFSPIFQDGSDDEDYQFFYEDEYDTSSHLTLLRYQDDD